MEPTDNPLEPPAGAETLSVADLTRRVKELLEAGFPSVWVEGEISNLARPRSGHLYMSLKDESAALRAVMFRHAAERLGFRPEEGDRVLALGALTVYPPRGDYQLRVMRLVPRGQGALQLAFERLRARLEAEGLFDTARKRPLPPLPRQIGVVTSPTGAAVHDILRVLHRRFPGVDVVLSPTRVQGPEATGEIVAALRRIQAVEGLELLIVGRGGGSLEDLWAFNEEAVARAIFACRLPVVSAVGHEVDVTIADLVADLRAPTPSAAAELVVPERRELTGRIDEAVARGLRALRRRLARDRDRLRRATRSRFLRDPQVLVETRAQRVDELLARLGRGMQSALDRGRRALDAARARLHSVGPRQVLERGFAVLSRVEDLAPLRSVDDLAPGDRLRARLARGRLECRVEVVEPPGGEPRRLDAIPPPARRAPPGPRQRRRSRRGHAEGQGCLFGGGGPGSGPVAGPEPGSAEDERDSRVGPGDSPRRDDR